MARNKWTNSTQIDSSPDSEKGSTMTKLVFAIFLVSLITASTTAPRWEQQFEYSKQAEFDVQGNIYVSSDQGKLIWMSDAKHCSEARVADDQQTVSCRVMQDQKLGNTVPSLQLEIYRKGGHKEIIEPGAPILDWHFWKDGQQVAVSYGQGDDQVTYALYDAATARVIEKLAEPSDESLLPQWAKSQAQIQEESVPMSAALTEERTKWISKVLRQIGKIRPGVRRKDLLKVFTTEGGISTRLQRTYVHTECPYIKVNVRFRAVNNENDGLNEDLDDIIESISQPYLAWSVAD
jgi:hypothetical protein